MIPQHRPGEDAGVGDEVFRVQGIPKDPLAFDPSNHHMMQGLIARWIPLTRICHPYPLVRLGVITRDKSPVGEALATGIPTATHSRIANRKSM